MKRLCAATALVLLSTTFALAQNSQVPNTGGVANPATPAPSNRATVGQSKNANPSNPQDMSNRSNPQDLTKPGANNAQDLVRPSK